MLVCAALLLALAPPLGAQARGGAVRFAAIVDASYAGADGARVAGTPTYRTIGAALARAPEAGTAPYRVLVRKGRYYEKLSVDRPNVALIGESRQGTVLTYDAAAGHPAPGGGTWGTRGSFTLRVTAPGFRLETMTVENGFDYPANAAKRDDDPTRVRGEQAVAVLLQTGSDRAVFRDCDITGYQDTLFADAGRAYFAGCTISGHVDFIFGGGQVVFDDVDVVSRDRGDPSNNGYIAAPSTRLWHPYGFLFLNCRLRKESAAMAPHSVALGRPWHPSGNPQAVGSAVFVNCRMDDHIKREGWDGMGSTTPAGERVWFTPESARFFEYANHGPGAVAWPTRRFLTDAEAGYYTPRQVLAGWDPGRN